MANTFSGGLTLPATKNLKIGWSETDAEDFNLLLMQVMTDNNNFAFVETKEVSVQSDTDPTDIDTNYDVLINNKLVASWNNSLNRSAEWLINCGPNNGYLCGPNDNNGDYYSYVVIDTSFWSAAKRTITSANSAAINELTWEDLSQTAGTFQVYFNTVGGSLIDMYEVVLSGQTIDEPANPVKELYHFDGWYLESNYQTEWDFATDTVTETLTLYAKWNFDENLLDLATTEHQGVVLLSDTEHFDQLEAIDHVITEEVEQKVLRSLIDDIDDALEEALAEIE